MRGRELICGDRHDGSQRDREPDCSPCLYYELGLAGARTERVVIREDIRTVEDRYRVDHFALRAVESGA